MSYVFTGIALVALALVVVIWRTIQDGRVIADRPKGAPMPAESRASGAVVGDFSGISGGADGVAAGGGGGDCGGASPC